MTALADRHRDQARRNLTHANYLLAEHADDPTSVQWAVTAAFYCAVHCIQAYLLNRGQAPRTHMQRARLIADPTHAVPMDGQTAYALLKQRSERARYRLALYKASYVRQALISRYLARVTDFVQL